MNDARRSVHRFSFDAGMRNRSDGSDNDEDTSPALHSPARVRFGQFGGLEDHAELGELLASWDGGVLPRRDDLEQR